MQSEVDSEPVSESSSELGSALGTEVGSASKAEVQSVMRTGIDSESAAQVQSEIGTGFDSGFGALQVLALDLDRGRQAPAAPPGPQLEMFEVRHQGNASGIPPAGWPPHGKQKEDRRRTVLV